MASAAIKRLATADRLSSGGRWPVALTLLSADIGGQGSSACVPIPGLNSFLPPNVPLYAPAQLALERGRRRRGAESAGRHALDARRAPTPRKLPSAAWGAATAQAGPP